MTDSTNVFFFCVAMLASGDKTERAVVFGVDLIVVGAITLFLGVDLEAGIAGGALAIILCVGYLTTLWERFTFSIQKIFSHRTLALTIHRISLRISTSETTVIVTVFTRFTIRCVTITAISKLIKLIAGRTAPTLSLIKITMRIAS